MDTYSYWPVHIRLHCYGYFKQAILMCIKAALCCISFENICFNYVKKIIRNTKYILKD